MNAPSFQRTPTSGYVNTGDRVLGRYAWAFISALVVSQESEKLIVKSLISGARPWGSRDVPSDHYIFAGEIPWHPSFASVALTEGSYRNGVRIGNGTADVEMLAHEYSWESYHTDMNRAGSARVPSQPFSHRFDLFSIAQAFDQFLPDGSRATITLSGVDGLEGDILYVREDLLKQYIGNRAIIWFVFGERELRPYPPSPPKWLVDAHRKQENAWHEVLTEADMKPKKKPPKKKNVVKYSPASAKKVSTQKVSKNKKLAKRKP